VSFDRLDSDGCMSTNDQVTLWSRARAASCPTPTRSAPRSSRCARSRRQLQADAEGASHDITIRVVGAASEDDAVEVGRSVARNNLFKAAIFGNDPNWGACSPRSARPRHPSTRTPSTSASTGCVCAATGPDRPRGGRPHPRATDVLIDLKAGEASATIFTNDLTHDYVHENSAYSS
jgi:glutamate N-acetyltransferase/amino-acid N-acetyltransferase